MTAIHQIHTDMVASITALKRDPMGTVHTGTAETGAIAILNRNQPAFYCVTPELFEYFQELAENAELFALAEERKANGQFVAVNLDDL
ncbi:type II toxin-antitoxin system Phd/YefM family antitoxin [Exercitatus varius]|uniref:type II toxin-antitoxin system Phd/YefM family antitoxin n=1 Tax=Exercitatus varius TaxID=67857 RepID=UPI00294B6B55|nr:stability protein StbD [Exercitatus varius]MDG2961701.1 stability protein StbD [Exercitatus varius]